MNMSDNEIVETIQIDADTRLVVRADDDAEPPTEWGDHVDEDGPEMQAWSAGEVYGVVLEKRVRWLRLNEKGVPAGAPPYAIAREHALSPSGYCRCGETFRLSPLGHAAHLRELEGDHTLDTWEEQGSIWGCYLNDTYTARRVAAEHFGLDFHA